MLQEGIIVLAIHQHHCAIVVLQVHAVKHFSEVLIRYIMLFAKLLQSQSILMPASSGMLKYVCYHSQIPVIHFYPGIFVAFHLLGVEQSLVPGESVRW